MYDAEPFDGDVNKYLRSIIIKRGYDGIIYNNQYDNEWEYLDVGDDSYIAFSPNQIKRSPSSNNMNDDVEELNERRGTRDV